MSKKWLKAAGVRAIKTFCQTLLAMIPTAVAINEVNWLVVLSTSLTASILSLATSVAGLPEVNEE